MSEVYKPAFGAGIGVTIPIVAEYGLKGARLGATPEEPTKGYKYSGILGLGLGIPEVLIAWQGERIGWPKEKEDKALLAAMGGASLVTGASILILDELRKRGAYAFRKKGVTLPLERGLERVEAPTEKLVEEI